MKIVPMRSTLPLAFMILLSAVCVAAPNNPPPPTPPPPPGLPLDGNLVMLLAAALLLGFYKIYQIQKYRKNPQQ